ncbi:undecaprenyl-diphosphate phosphatase [Isoptericola sp. b441]|uniref:Undecaprenyl-diphosphatase n=1 Tax=Actinotalea lenta TaxID=3064654 RepID=A0ABT9D9H2_9CELL|nr:MULTISPECIES: undecaprenyl-diphosphate phosphatase [unclassified Isoptericola]MDO8107536.1 undecaprenyl-diphosphate phosphatase [Isoptericola sp. b441]MDO8120804.1 undecaprenyl-diphosphate phosphatase [Isoptericola sp. b490]
MDMLQALLLGIVEGVTEFLPVSSTGHLTIVEELLGMKVDDAGVTAFTAIIQVGAIIAVVGYFARDIVALVRAWAVGLGNREQRGVDYRLAWFVIIGSIPVGIVGFLARDVISGGLRNLWVVVAALVLWSIPMVLAERVGRRIRPLEQVTIRDAVVIGLVQCLALIPGVSRSGATISAGLFLDIDRVAATRISFYLSIPALVAAGGYEAATQASAISASVGWGPTMLAMLVSLVVAWVSIAWLLRLVAHHSIVVFVWYRVALAAVVAGLLAAGVIAAA